MIYRCKFKTLDFSISDFLTSSFFLPSEHKNFRYLSETVKIVSVSDFDVKIINNFIAFDFPFRIICASYQIHRQHPWIRKTILQNLSTAPAPIHIIHRCFFMICIIIIFLFDRIYLSILALTSVCTGDHITSQPTARVW